MTKPAMAPNGCVAVSALHPVLQRHAEVVAIVKGDTFTTLEGVESLMGRKDIQQEMQHFNQRSVR